MENLTPVMRLSAADEQPGEQPGELTFARYSSTCAVSVGKVMMFNGRLNFPSRIVRRCRWSAREHVDSFDPAHNVGHGLQGHIRL